MRSKIMVEKAEIDLNKMIVYLNNKSKKINNSEKVLSEMLASPGTTFSRRNRTTFGISQERSIDVMITRLRQKMINPKNPKYLQTIRGSLCSLD